MKDEITLAKQSIEYLPLCRQSPSLIYNQGVPSRSLYDLAQRSLQHRPLLWLTPLCAIGCAAGMRWALLLAEQSTFVARESSIFFLPLFPTFGFAYLAWRWRGKMPQLATLFFGLAAACFLCCVTARRTLPSQHDISRLTANVNANAALQKPVITVRGYVADDPRRSEWSTQFPFECIEADYNGERKKVEGRVWLRLPSMPELKTQLGRELQVGDAIQVTALLAALPSPSNPGERDEHLQYILKQCWADAEIKSPGDVRLLSAPPRFLLARHIAVLRKNILAHYEQAFMSLSTPYPRATAQLMTAMSFGEGGLAEPLPRRIRDDFRAAGMSHLLIASGTQVSFLVLLLLGSARVLGLRRWPLLVVLIPSLVAYALLAGGAASIWRATIAGLCVAITLLQGRDVDALTLWSAAFLALIAIDPGQIFDIGFQLSFAATWGLIVIGSVARVHFANGFGSNFLTDLMAFSLAAQLGVAPILAYHFGKLPLAGIGVNLVGVPLAGILVGTGLTDLILPINLLHWVNYWLAGTIAQTASWAAGLPGASLERPPLRLLWTVALYGTMILCALGLSSQTGGWLLLRKNFLDHFWLPLREEVLLWRRRRKVRWRWQTPIALLVLFGAIATGRAALSTQTPPLRITMLDVGQGESIIIQSPTGRTVLIDGGGVAKYEREDVGRSVIVPFLHANGVKKIDALVITHADKDHCNGLRATLREIPVGFVVDGGRTGDGTEVEYLELQQALRLAKIPVTKARAGQRLNLGSGAVLRVLAPLAPPMRGDHVDNNNAAVMRLDYGQTSTLLTADIEQSTEERLLRRVAPLRCTILKVAHHGSKTSSNELFLRAAQPQAALISCGRYNQFRHPNSEVLQRLRNHRVSTFRTDVNGAIDVLCDGNECWIQTQR